MPVSQTKLDVIIVDDEIEASTNLKNILNTYVDADINILGIAANTRQAEEQINRLKPDAVFLDIEMPNENAFHFLDRIAPFDFEVVFVTAYDEYAIRAFKLNAIDYILKPISIAELTSAVQKLKERVFYKRLLKENHVSYADISRQLSTRVKQQSITLKDNNRVDVVQFKDICFIEAQGSYSRIVFLKDNVISEITMITSTGEYEELLPDDMFFRIHKSYLINCQHVKKVLKDDSGHIVIRGEFTLPVSRRRYTQLIEFLKNNRWGQ